MPTSNAPDGHWDASRLPRNAEENKRAQAVIDAQQRHQSEIDQARERAIRAGVPPEAVDDIIKRLENEPAISAPNTGRNFTVEAIDGYTARFLAAKRGRGTAGGTATPSPPAGVPTPTATEPAKGSGGSGGKGPPVAQGPTPRPDDDDKPTYRLIEVPDKNGRIQRRWVRISEQDAKAYRQALAEHYDRLLNETPPGFTQLQKAAWRHQRMLEFRRQWLEGFYRNRDK